MVVLFVDQREGKFAGVVIVDQRYYSYLLGAGRGRDALLPDESVADQVADRLAARGIALIFTTAVERFQESRLQRNADAPGSAMGGFLFHRGETQSSLRLPSLSPLARAIARGSRFS